MLGGDGTEFELELDEDAEAIIADEEEEEKEEEKEEEEEEEEEAEAGETSGFCGRGVLLSPVFLFLLDLGFCGGSVHFGQPRKMRHDDR